MIRQAITILVELIKIFSSARSLMHFRANVKKAVVHIIRYRKGIDGIEKGFILSYLFSYNIIFPLDMSKVVFAISCAINYIKTTKYIHIIYIILCY